MLKRLVITTAFAALAGGACAADLRGPIIEAPAAYGVIPAFSWTGGYIGVNVGVGSATPDYSYNVSTAPYVKPGYPGGYNQGGPYDGQPDEYVAGTSANGSERLRSGGVLGGVQVGYNYAFGAGALGGFGVGGGALGAIGLGGVGIVPVIGVEADFDGSGISSGAALGQFAQGFPLGDNNYVGVRSDLDYFGTVRGRLGVAFDRLLVYGTGGFAYGQVETSVSAPGNGVYARKSNFHTGVAYGGGVQYAITNNLLLRAEYLHIDLGRKGVPVGGGDSHLSYSLYERPSLDLVRAGLDYRFDFATAVAPPPVIARY